MMEIHGKKTVVCKHCHDVIVQQELNKNKYQLKAIYQMLNTSILNQDQAMQQIALTVYKHIQKMTHIKTNALILGPTGSGKTEVARQMEAYCGKDFPVLIEDISAYTPSGYKGNDISEMIQHVYDISGYDKERSERAIIFLDEFDKIIEVDTENGLNLLMQKSLLKFIEGKEVPVTRKDGTVEYINTSNILFICMGAFTRLLEERERGCNKTPIGFCTKEEQNEQLSLFMELRKDGMIPELLARFRAVVQLNKLSAESLYDIVISKKDIWQEYSKLFVEQEKNFRIKKETIQYACQVAYFNGTGVRGVFQEIETIISQKVFAKDQSICI